MRGLIVLAVLLQGCAMIGAKYLGPDDVAEAVQIMKAEGVSGCAWLRGHANPPASQLDFDLIISLGGIQYPECVKTLRP